MVAAMEEWTKMKKIEQEFSGFGEYCQINRKVINDLFKSIQVKEIYFKDKKNTINLS